MASYSTIFTVIINSLWVILYVGAVPSQTANAYDELKQWYPDLLDIPDSSNQHAVTFSKTDAGVDEKRNAFNDKLRGLRRLSRIIDGLRYESAIRPAKKSPEFVDELDSANGNGGKHIVSAGHALDQNSGALSSDAIPVEAGELRAVVSPQGMGERPVGDVSQASNDQLGEWKLQRLSETPSRMTATVDDQSETSLPKRSPGADSLGLDVFRQKSRESRRRWGGKASRPQPFRIGLFGKRGAETLGMVDTGDLVDIIAEMLRGNSNANQHGRPY